MRRMVTHRPAFSRPITANILSQCETAQPGNTSATRSKLIATSGNTLATLGNPIADLETPLAAFGMGLAHAFPLLHIHLPA